MSMLSEKQTTALTFDNCNQALQQICEERIFEQMCTVFTIDTQLVQDSSQDWQFVKPNFESFVSSVVKPNSHRYM
jgi:hypothetical protein